MKIDTELLAKMEKKALENFNLINKGKDSFVDKEKEKLIHRMENTQEAIAEILSIVNLAENYKIDEINEIIRAYTYAGVVSGQAFTVNSDTNEITGFSIKNEGVTITIEKNIIMFNLGLGSPYEYQYQTIHQKGDLSIKSFDFEKLYDKTTDKNFVEVKEIIGKLHNALNIYEKFEQDINAAMVRYTVGLEEEHELD